MVTQCSADDLNSARGDLLGLHNHSRTVLRGNPVRRLSSRMDSPSRKCSRRSLANMPTLITPVLPLMVRAGQCLYVGQFSAINGPVLGDRQQRGGTAVAKTSVRLGKFGKISWENCGTGKYAPVHLGTRKPNKINGAGDRTRTYTPCGART